MKSKNELKETDIKNRAYYYFDDIINGAKINVSNILSDKKLYEKLKRVQNNCILSLIKYMDLIYLLTIKLNI